MMLVLDANLSGILAKPLGQAWLTILPSYAIAI